jgi:hypothetical protein
LADEFYVVWRKAVLIEIFLTLNGEDGRNVVLLQFLNIRFRFGIAADINLRCNLRENNLIDAELVNNDGFAP